MDDEPTGGQGLVMGGLDRVGSGVVLARESLTSFGQPEYLGGTCRIKQKMILPRKRWEETLFCTRSHFMSDASQAQSLKLFEWCMPTLHDFRVL